MSLARAMTKRMRRSEAPPMPSRSASARTPGQRIDRSTISMPVALLSTTNMLSYNAPDISTMRHASNGSTATNLSGDDSDQSTTRSRSSSNQSRETLTDASSVGSSPTSPEPNHLSCYFQAPATAARESTSSSKVIRNAESMSSISAEPATLASPPIPARALSHSKRAHERVASKRSVQNVKPTSSISARDSTRSSHEQRTSLDIVKNTSEEHPFGKELEQLNEVVEEFGGVVRHAELEEDSAVMSKLGLGRFCATDYLSEIQPLFNSLFESRYLAAPTAWI